jgi:hypothetical protein
LAATKIQTAIAIEIGRHDLFGACSGREGCLRGERGGRDVALLQDFQARTERAEGRAVDFFGVIAEKSLGGQPAGERGQTFHEAQFSTGH